MTELVLADPQAPVPESPFCDVVVSFGSGCPSSVQASAMMRLERWLREEGVPAQVLKQTMADDSKLRRSMTPEQRSKL